MNNGLFGGFLLIGEWVLYPQTRAAESMFSFLVAPSQAQHQGARRPVWTNTSCPLSLWWLCLGFQHTGLGPVPVIKEHQAKRQSIGSLLGPGLAREGLHVRHICGMSERLLQWHENHWGWYVFKCLSLVSFEEFQYSWVLEDTFQNIHMQGMRSWNFS